MRKILSEFEAVICEVAATNCSTVCGSNGQSKVEVVKIANINCVIDHSYLYSGGRGRNLISIFKKTFENPQLYHCREKI